MALQKRPLALAISLLQLRRMGPAIYRNRWRADLVRRQGQRRSRTAADLQPAHRHQRHQDRRAAARHPQTVKVPQSLLRDQAVHSLQDAEVGPGVGLSTGDGQRDQVTIRGFSAIADQFIDGLRDDALYFRDLSNVEQVEVVKGPASVLYGAARPAA
jgi:catecholate siderophore receptor